VRLALAAHAPYTRKVMAWPRSHPNILAGPYLDRAAHLRQDEARLRAVIADPATLVVPVWRACNCIVLAETGIRAQLLVGVQQLGEFEPVSLAESTIVLGNFRGQTTIVLELLSEQPPRLPDGSSFRELRSVAGELPAEEAALLAYARAMVLWRERHRFCGRCGAPALASHSGHVLTCSVASCGNQQFPRIDPAVIVLVSDGEHALLGRQAAWPKGRYSTIAGFVEPGESLEDAVVREVLEETGVSVSGVEYHSSQPWPFPSSLMLGFMARASVQPIRLNDAELEDARWVTRAQIAAGEIALPTQHSISFRLIEDWYDLGAERGLREEPGAQIWSSQVR
jgi:NAD+ diphosphatase